MLEQREPSIEAIPKERGRFGCHLTGSVIEESGNPGGLLTTSHSIDNRRETPFIDQVHQLQLEALGETSEGLLFEMAQRHYQSRGKNLRSQVLLALAQALEVPTFRALPWAACCEMLHNATLVHDDLQDGDEVRRNAPTTWKLYGKNQAINLGDYLLSLAPSLVLSSPVLLDSEKLKLVQAYCQMSTQIVGGQCRDLNLSEHLFSTDLFSLYLRCTQEKTGALFATMIEGLLLLAQASEERHDNLLQIFEVFGLIFQLQDDILDLYGNKGRQQVGCDIQEGKISFLVAMHLRFHPDDGEALQRILTKNRDETDIFDIEWVRERFSTLKTLQQCLDYLFLKLQEAERQMASLASPVLREFLQTSFQRILQPISHLDSRFLLQSAAGEVPQ